MKHLFSPWNKKMEYPTKEAVKKIDIESAKDLLEYFQDFVSLALVFTLNK